MKPWREHIGRSGRPIFKLEEGDLECLADRQIVLSMSGGKDSAAVALLLEANGLPFDAVFMDTGWEHPAVPAYIDEVLRPRFGDVRRLSGGEGLADMIRRKGVFPARRMRFCTQELKVWPFKAYVDERLDSGDDVVNAIGVRAGESRARAKAPRWDVDDYLDIDVWRPILSHSYDDVIEMHQVAGLDPNPLYLAGATRVGCFPCIMSRKAEVAMVAKLWPERIAEIREMEAELSAQARERVLADAAARGRHQRKIADRAAFLRLRDALDEHGDAAWPDLRWERWKWYKRHRRQMPSGLKTAADTARQRVLDLTIEEGPRLFADDAVEALSDRMLRRNFFHGRTDDGIDEVVAWSATDWGGRQLSMFDSSARDGCTRWGMCDTAGADESRVVVIEEPGTPEPDLRSGNPRCDANESR